MSRLVCPVCGVGPFTIRKAYDAHVAGCAPPAAEPEPVLEAAPAPEPAVPDELVCEQCGAGPYTSTKGYKAHVRSHDQVTCPDCGRLCAGKGGLAKHRNHAHGAVSASTQEKAAKRQRAADRAAARAAEQAAPKPTATAIAGALADMYPGGHRDLIARLATFVADNRPGPDLWIVTTTDGRPWLCRVGQIGLLAQREDVPVIAVRVSDIYTHLDQPRPKAATTA
jgi:uncharacterized C2H2 Zn-finger protein